MVGRLKQVTQVIDGPRRQIELPAATTSRRSHSTRRRVVSRRLRFGGAVLIALSALMACDTTSPEAAATPAAESTPPQVAASQTALLQLVDQDTNGMITARDQGARFPGEKFLAKETLKVISHEVRHMNGKNFRKIFNFLDDSDTSKLLAHSDEVADAIDQLVNYLDKPQAVMREVLYNRLVKFMSPGAAEDIAGAVAGVISNALF